MKIDLLIKTLTKILAYLFKIWLHKHLAKCMKNRFSSKRSFPKIFLFWNTTVCCNVFTTWYQCYKPVLWKDGTFFFFRNRRKCSVVHLFLNKFCFCYKSIAVTMRNKSINSLPHVPVIVNLSKPSLKVFTNIKFIKIQSLKGSHQFKKRNLFHIILTT